MTDLPVNKTLDEVNAVIQNVNDLGVQLAQAILIANVTWLGFPVIKTLLGWALAWLEFKLNGQEKAGINFFIIDAQVHSEVSELGRALKQVSDAKNTGSPDVLAAAIQVYAQAHKRLVRWDGVASH